MEGPKGFCGMPAAVSQTFAVYCTGSNVLVSPNLVVHFAASACCDTLVQAVAKLLNYKPECVKVHYLNPGGPELSPVVCTDNQQAYNAKSTASIKAWSEIALQDPVAAIKIYVTQRSSVEFALNTIASDASYGHFDTIVFESMSATLRSNWRVALYAIKKNCYCIKYVSTELRCNKQFVLAAVSANSNVLRVLRNEHYKYRHDKQFVVAAVTRNGCALEYALEQFKQDVEVVLAAVNQAGYTLQYAHPDMQARFDVVFAAVNQNGAEIIYGSYGLARNKQIVLAALKTCSYALTAVDADELWNDKEVVFAAVNADGRMLIHAPPCLRADKDVVLAACTNYLRAMQYANSDESLSCSSQRSFVQETSSQQSFGQGPLTDRAVLQQLVQRWGQERVESTAKDTLIADQAAQVCKLLKTL
jgi:hypothetical protein